MIKYLGSKRTLVPVLGTIARSVGARTALDLFTGTTRVAQEFCRSGSEVWAVDTAAYSHVLAQCFVEKDAARVDPAEVADALARLDALPEVDGYVTETFCRQARYFQPFNGRRIDAIRQGIDDLYGDDPLRPVLLTSLLLAADAVDSTVGLQMAYLKRWAPRSAKPLTLRVPALTPGAGHAIRGDAATVVRELPKVDLAYLDPPYNQHRYFSNYHVWETLVRWDTPETYGIARKRVDCRDEARHSVFNSRAAMPAALAALIADVRAEVVVVSFSNEGFVPLAALQEMCAVRGAVHTLSFDARRYVGSLIGIHDPRGRRVGQVSHTRNTEYVLVCGEPGRVEAAVAALAPGREGDDRGLADAPDRACTV